MEVNLDWTIVLENLQVGVLVTDVELEGPSGPRILYANQAWIEMTGYHRNELANRTPRILQGPASDSSVLKRLRQDLEEGRVFHGQTWNYRKSGEPFMMNWYCYAVLGPRGKPVYYVAEQRDVTQLEELRMKERLAINPHDPEATSFFRVIADFRARNA